MRRTQKTGHNNSTGHHISTSEATQALVGHEHILTIPDTPSLRTSCAAFSDSHNTDCYSDCQSTATIKAFISISTASIFEVVDD